MALAPVAPSPPVPAERSPAGGLIAIAAVGSAFGGLLQHQRDADPLSTAFAVGVTFAGTFVALVILRVVFRLTMAVCRIALPIGLLLLIGCAFDWRWAEMLVDWLVATGSQAVAAAERLWSLANR